MHKPVIIVPSVRPAAPLRRPIVIALAACFSVILAALAALVALAVSPGTATLFSPPFSPTGEDGLIAEGMVVTLSDHDLPAIARVNPALRDAMQRAQRDAAASGIVFQVTSGWRSEAYQRWLFDDAVKLYASEEVAGKYVATPARSQHVTGDAVDIGPLEAQLWLMEHGSDYGICQTYANERWHFELATDDGGTCPEMKLDAAS